MRDLRALLVALLVLDCAASAQSLSSLAPSVVFSASLLPEGPEFSIVEKSDYSRYLEGRYVGHVYRESRGLLRARGAGYSGDCYVLEETIRDERLSSRRVDGSLDLEWSAGSGNLVAASDSGFPRYRGLLAEAPDKLEEGLSWISAGSYFLDLRDLGVGGEEGKAFELPFLAEYRVRGQASLDGRPFLLVSCLFALRLEATSAGLAGAGLAGAGTAGPAGGPLPSAPPSVAGRHELDLYLDAGTGRLAFLRDRFDDSYRLPGGASERRNGFTLVFFRGVSRFALASPPGPAAPSEKAAPAEGAASSVSSSGAIGSSALQGQGAESLKKAGVDVVESDRNVVLRVRDLPFVADSDEIVAGEKWRLDAIAEALKKIPERSFLVEGHSASVGKPEGELELSERRAKRIVDELVGRGIAAARFIYRGLGSSKPLASNESEEGRARNRRVEITILDF
jgi:OmpA-OmpF porin, OOP family